MAEKSGCNVSCFSRAAGVLCLQAYPRPNCTAEQIPRYGDATARVFVMRSDDLKHWDWPGKADQGQSHTNTRR